MKTTIKLLFALLITLTTSCQSDDDGGGDPISQLPEATQTGEQTIGCLVDGEPLLPNASGGIQCFYQFIDGEYFLGISYAEDIGEASRFINIITQNIDLQVGETYTLDKNFNDDMDFNGAGAVYSSYDEILQGGSQYNTNNQFFGSLTITKISDGIISGTFEFTAEEISTGEIIEITEGRFDLLCTN